MRKSTQKHCTRCLVPYGLSVSCCSYEAILSSTENMCIKCNCVARRSQPTISRVTIHICESQRQSGGLTPRALLLPMVFIEALNIPALFRPAQWMWIGQNTSSREFPITGFHTELQHWSQNEQCNCNLLGYPSQILCQLAFNTKKSGQQCYTQRIEQQARAIAQENSLDRAEKDS